MGLALGSGYRANMEAYYPYDAGVAVDAPLTKQSAQPLLAAVNRQCPVEDSVTYFLYETPYGTEAMALSDYNHLRRILDLEEAELGPGEYLVHCDTWNFWEEIQQSLAQAPMLSLAGWRLTPGTPSLRTEPMEQYQMAGERGYALVVPDQVAQSLPEKGWRVVMDLQGGGTAALREEIRTFLHSAQWRPQLLPGRTMPEKVTMGVSVQAWGVANSLTGFTTLSFCGLYLSLVILLLSCTILVFHQLSALDRNQRQYAILRQLGVDRQTRSRWMAWELGTFFLLPFLLPAGVTGLLSAAAQRLMGPAVLQPGVFLLCGAAALGIFAGVYGLYFGVTYRLFRRSVG